MKDASGNVLAADYAWSFRVASLLGAACTGDCDGNGEVTVDELIKGVNIALGTAGLDTCSVFDSSGDGEVTVDELLQGVNIALNGCGS